MIRAIVNYVQKPPPIPSAYVDGFLYVTIALFGFLAASFGSDEAAKWISAQALFWLRTLTGATSASLLALKMFRSTAFAEHAAAKENNPTVSTTTTADSGITPKP